MNNLKIGTHYIHVGIVQVQKDLVDLSKHYIHEIDALVSIDRAECVALEKKKTCKNGYLVD